MKNKTSWVDGGRIETAVAVVVLAVVVGLFARFYRPTLDPAPAPTTTLQAPATAGPTAPQ